MRQLKLFFDKAQTQFGGSLLTGRRKCRRPLSLKNSHHLVLKAKSSVCLLQSRAQVENTLRRYGARFGVKIYALAVHSDHIHLQILLSSRSGYVKWIRAVTSVLVQKIRGLRFGLRPWTRVVAWGRAFRWVKIYIGHNRREGDFLCDGWEQVARCRDKIFAGTALEGIDLPGPEPAFLARE